MADVNLLVPRGNERELVSHGAPRPEQKQLSRLTLLVGLTATSGAVVIVMAACSPACGGALWCLELHRGQGKTSENPPTLDRSNYPSRTCA